MENILILFGGKSAENYVSAITASSISRVLMDSKYNIYTMYISEEGVFSEVRAHKEVIDSPEDMIGKHKFNHKSHLDSLKNIIDFVKENEVIVFPALHGTYGEDGKLQGLLEVLDIPYTGNSVASSAIAMDKIICKDVLEKYNIPQGKYIGFSEKEALNTEYVLESIKDYNYPVFVKPSRLGSSVGISKVDREEDIKRAIDIALEYDYKIIIEEGIKGREMQISVIGNDQPRASAVGEFIQEKDFMDYEAKYTKGKLKAVIPANISEAESDAMRKTAIDAYKAIGGLGLSRVDFFFTESREFFIGEINTMPGFTMQSMTPKLWEIQESLGYTSLIEEIIDFAVEEYERKSKLKHIM